MTLLYAGIHKPSTCREMWTNVVSLMNEQPSHLFPQSRLGTTSWSREVKNSKHINQVERFCIDYIVVAFLKVLICKAGDFVFRISPPLEHSATCAPLMLVRCSPTFHLTRQYRSIQISVQVNTDICAKKLMQKKSKEEEKTLEELNSAHCRSQANCQLVQTSYIKRVVLFLPYNKHLINRAKSVCMGESWPRSCVHTSLGSVCTYDLGQDSPIQTSC